MKIPSSLSSSSSSSKKKFICPLSNQIMIDPVIDREGNSYEREAISHWLIDRGNKRSPVTGSPLHISHLQTNETLKKKIAKEYRKNNNIVVVGTTNNTTTNYTTTTTAGTGTTTVRQVSPTVGDVRKSVESSHGSSGPGKGVKKFLKRINPFKKSSCETEVHIVIDNPPPPSPSSSSPSSPSPPQSSPVSSPLDVIMNDISDGANDDDDDLSTLATPMQQEGIISSEEYGDAPMFGDQSLSTYANSRYYNRGGSSVSDTSAGITLETRGAHTQGTSSGVDTLFDNSHAGAMHSGASSCCYSVISDDSFFNPQNRREEVIEIEAPPGKLGISIDTPEDGSDPIIHDVKDFSSIADQIQVSDRLIAIDGEDVRYCTAVKIAKLISKKASNPIRILTVVRTILDDDHQVDSLLGPRDSEDEEEEEEHQW